MGRKKRGRGHHNHQSTGSHHSTVGNPSKIRSERVNSRAALASTPPSVQSETIPSRHRRESPGRTTSGHPRHHPNNRLDITYEGRGRQTRAFRGVHEGTKNWRRRGNHTHSENGRQYQYADGQSGQRPWCHQRPRGRGRRYNGNTRHHYATRKQSSGQRSNPGPSTEVQESQPGGSTSNAVSVAAESHSSNDIEIPGFYYDREKKKYFRILPSQNNTISKVITKDTIKIQKTEEYRQQKLREFALKTIQMDCSYDFPVKKRMCYNSKNITELVSLGCFGEVDLNRTVGYRHKILKTLLSNLHVSCKRKVFLDAATPYEKLEHMLQMIQSVDQRRLLCMWSLDGLIVQRVQLLQVNRLGKPRCGDDNGGSSSLDVSPVGTALFQSASKITNICWAAFPDTGTAQPPILYTTTCFLGNNPSLASLRRLDVSSSDGADSGSQLISVLNLGRKATWTCAWSPCAQKFSIGSEGCSLLIDVATNRMWELFTQKSDVFTQTFSQDGDTLYSGSRKGQVVMHDLRSISTRYVSSLHHRSSVCHLHLLASGNHLLVTDFSGRLSQWDLRMRRVVLDYHGHNNSYTRIPFKVDPTESVLCAAGQDCFTRLWDVRSGEQLTSIPPPHPVSRDTIPSVCLYPTPGRNVDQPGLLMGTLEKLHFYSTRLDQQSDTVGQS